MACCYGVAITEIARCMDTVSVICDFCDCVLKFAKAKLLCKTCCHVCGQLILINRAPTAGISTVL